MFIYFLVIFLGMWGVVNLCLAKKNNAKRVKELKYLGNVVILGLVVFIEEFSKDAFSLLLPYFFFLIIILIGVSFLRRDESVKRVLDPLLLSCIIASLFLNFNGFNLKKNIWKDEVTINEVSRFSQIWNEPVFKKIKLCDPSYLMDFLSQRNICSGGLKIDKGRFVYDEREWLNLLIKKNEELPPMVFISKQFERYLVVNNYKVFGESLNKLLFYNYNPIKFKPAIVWVRKDKKELFSLVKKKLNIDFS